MYDSDLTDAQWQHIEPLFKGQTFRKHHPKDLVNASFYLSRTGCPWRMLPRGSGGFPPWKTVYYHFRRWMASGLIERLHDALRRAARVKKGGKPSPSAAIIDSQSVKSSRIGGPGRGFDGGKLVKGRERHIVTDTPGLVLAVMVHSASRAGSQAAAHLLKRLVGKVPRLRVIFADQGYAGPRRGWSGAVSGGCARWWSGKKAARLRGAGEAPSSWSERLRGLEATAG